jgi:uncharacterized OB-fold protein
VQIEPGAEGVVYSETVVYAAPARFASEAPYQIAIIELSTGERVTSRIEGRVQIGDRVAFTGTLEGVPRFALLSGRGPAR